MDTETRTGTDSVAADPLSSIVLDHTTDGVVVSDGDGVIVYVNKPLLALFGYESDELLGAPIEILVPDYHRDHHSDHVKRFLHSPEHRPMGRDDLDIEGRHANGSSFPIDVQLDALPSGSLIVATVRAMARQRQSSVDFAIVRIDLANARDQIVRLQKSLDLVIQRLFALGTSIEASALDEPVLLERMAGATRRINEIIDTVQEQRLPPRSIIPNPQGPSTMALPLVLCSHGGMDEDPPKVTVFLLDDHELVREGVRQLLEADGTIEVVGEAATCADAIARIRATRPQVAVLDVQLPDGNGVEVCREVRSLNPDLVCLMLTSFSDEEALFQSVMAGAAGYVLKQIRGNDLVSAVHRVSRGESLIDPAVTGQLLERLRNPHQDQDPRLAALTELERTILDLVAEGLTNRQIAVKVNRAEKTVKNYMSSILMKLGMTRRTEAAVFAVRAKNDH